MRKHITPILSASLLALCASAHADVIGVHLVSYHSADTYSVKEETPWRVCNSRINEFGMATTCSSGVSTEHRDRKYNNTNLGLYWRDDSGLTAGFYRNSYGRISTYVGWTFESSQWHDLTASVTVAAITGYKGYAGSGAIRVMAMPAVTWHATKQTAFRLAGGPTKDGALLHLSMEFTR
jgi:hypothetical protein